jgi:glycosyltransferase involved in cell wall biosynthesis
MRVEPPVSRDRSIRVLRVIARLNVGGPALHVSYLTQGLEARGYRTTLAAGQVGPGEESMAFVARARGVEVLEIPQLGRELNPVLDPIAVRRIAGLIRELRPHILHTHTAKAGALGRVAALAARSARPPIVVHTYHGHVLTGYFDPVRQAAYRTIERRLARMTTRLVAVSPEVRDDLLALGVGRPEQFTVIRLGIDLDERSAGSAADRTRLRSRLELPEEAFVVGWIGRMTAIKRLPDVLASFAELRRRGVEARLCLVGDGPDRAEAERLASGLGIAGDALFLGYQADIAPYYALFDVLLLPSGNEGTPVVAIESLAAAKPVVATRVGGVPDVVEDAADGFLAPVGDVKGLADGLERLARDPQLRAQMGRRGRERTLPRYRVERLIDDVDSLYRELLAEKGIALPEAAPGEG